MNLDQRVSQRFAELEEQGRRIPIKSASVGMSETADTEAFQQWASSAMHLVATVFGENSPHYSNLAGAYGKFRGLSSQMRAARGVFLAAKADYDGGYLFSVQAAISGEIFGDFVTAAKTVLSEDQKDVAAVLACAALEDALKRFAEIQGLDPSEKDMTEVINALKGAGLLSGPQKSLVDGII